MTPPTFYNRLETLTAKYENANEIEQLHLSNDLERFVERPTVTVSNEHFRRTVLAIDELVTAVGTSGSKFFTDAFLSSRGVRELANPAFMNDFCLLDSKSKQVFVDMLVYIPPETNVQQKVLNILEEVCLEHRDMYLGS